jgi:hypothetical protein
LIIKTRGAITIEPFDVDDPGCESRSNNPSLKRPICLGAPE